ncbi:MAG: alpha/beta fold hydrolase [Clostridia bacterium]|nr:alpha/beta fold hydrolase [Clostridia bacterium]
MGNKDPGERLINDAKTLAKLALRTGLQIGTILGAKAAYDAFFKRYEKRDINTVFGEFDYSRVAERLPRTTFFFPSGRWKLQGYFYPCKGAKGMVVVCHGMHAGADDYIPFIEFFVRNGYAVFTYDCQGTYASEGNSTVGMCTPLVNLDHALTYIKNNKQLSQYPLFLFGHSWGGYAATSVLSIHKNIRGCSAVAPFNSGYTLLAEKGEQYTGPFSDVLKIDFPKEFLNAYQTLLFGNYTKFDAVKGINSTNIPVYIAHGNRDFVISFGHQSVISHRAEIRKKNVTYYIGTDSLAGHNTILHSPRAVEYQEKVEKNLKRLKKEYDRDLTQQELTDFCNGVDHALYSEVNLEMMREILNMFNKAL